MDIDPRELLNIARIMNVAEVGLLQSDIVKKTSISYGTANKLFNKCVRHKFIEVETLGGRGRPKRCKKIDQKVKWMLASMKEIFESVEYDMNEDREEVSPGVFKMRIAQLYFSYVNRELFYLFKNKTNGDRALKVLNAWFNTGTGVKSRILENIKSLDSERHEIFEKGVKLLEEMGIAKYNKKIGSLLISVEKISEMIGERKFRKKFETTLTSFR